MIFTGHNVWGVSDLEPHLKEEKEEKCDNLAIITAVFAVVLI